MTTVADRAHMRAVASLGCIACRNMGIEPGECGIHHIRAGQGLKRASHREVLPLCHFHHQGAGGIHTIGRKDWEKRHGTERELLAQVMNELDGGPI